MFLNILYHALLKLSKNKQYILIASFGMTVSTFVVLTVFVLSHAVKSLVLSYYLQSFPVLTVITCQLEGDSAYMLSEEEIESLVSKYNLDISEAIYHSDSSVLCQISGHSNQIMLTGACGLPLQAEMCAGNFLPVFREQIASFHSVVLSEDIAEAVFGNAGNAVGKEIVLHTNMGNAETYCVCGVYRSDLDYDVPLAYTSLRDYSIISGNQNANRISTVQFRLSDISKNAQVAGSIRRLLKKRFPSGFNYYVHILNLDLEKDVSSVIRIITIVFLIGAGIIFIVSGINIRNVLMSIMQSYTHIIGIEKALGSSCAAIVAEYMLQGVVIALTGTVFGFLASVLMLLCGNAHMQQILCCAAHFAKADYLNNVQLRLYFCSSDILLAVLMAVGTVLFFCFKPIRQIAGMKPIDAIRQ